ncbi:hypothetical protein BKA63DRAFT_596095, partial [Paraphoma chrysanthemicola]
DRIEYHAEQLGRSVCQNFVTLNDIVQRYEELIRKRWIKKSTSQRRELLLEAWPNMPKDPEPNPWCLVPYINLENLTKAKPLLIFINARGRHAPWSFTGTEEHFYLLARMSPCAEKAFCKGTTIHFTRHPDPSTFGRVERIRNPHEHYRATEDYFEVCARTGIQILHLQDSILGFLVKCAKSLLHDMTVPQMLACAVQPEPQLSELLDGDIVGHTSFSHILMTAPFRGWHSLNFEKLQGYIAASLDMQQEHVWALHEDPSYLADTIQEYESHAPHKSSNTPGATWQNLSKKAYRNLIITVIVDEAYCMLAGWQELNTRFSAFDKLFREGISIHDQLHAVGEVEHIAEWMKDCLAKKIGDAYLFTPNIRRLMKRDLEDGSGLFVTPISSFTKAQDSMLRFFEAYQKPTKILNNTAILSYTLEGIDRLVQTHPECRAMLSGRLLSLLTDVSVLGECLRQINLWQRSPEVKSCDHSGCKYIYKTEGLENFLDWLQPLKDYSFPTNDIHPIQEKLYYPVHKRRTRESVNEMQKAEVNLDKFWASVNTMFKDKTGVAQHRIIRECLEGGGKMQRTEPWVDRDAPKVVKKKSLEYEYQPFSRMAHNRELQITGTFDRMAVEEKSKTKTRGITDQPFEGVDEDSPIANDCIPNQTPTTILVDQRTYKVFKTLFYTPTYETGDLPKAVKWNDFKRAMVRVGFAVEKLQGSAWQFSPGDAFIAERNIQFHEPHPENDIPYVMAKRFGRRLARVYGWRGDMFKLA